MTAAVHAAAVDAHAPSLLAAIEQIAVPKGTWSYTDPARLLAERVGAHTARTVLAEVGVPQQTLVSDAIAAILDGELAVAVVVGGEARRWARGEGRVETAQPDAVPDQHLTPNGELVAPAEIAAKAWQPVQQYALIENARRAAEGLTLDAHLADIDALWRHFRDVAATNADAAFPDGGGDRPLAFPYTARHSTQWTVDQAAALLLCSVDAAVAHGVPRERWLFPHVALESSFALSLSRRREMHRWPAMRVLGEAAARHLSRPLATIEHVELYSCFPSAVRVQQRELALPFDRTPTVTGGMAFAGGPFNNFTYQATAAIGARLRAEPGTFGLVTTVSGLLTKPGLAVWSTEEPTEPPYVADLAPAAAAATASVDVATADDVRGMHARIASYTVTYDDAGAPARVVLVLDLPDGRRTVVALDDAALAARATTDDVIGETLTVP